MSCNTIGLRSKPVLKKGGFVVTRCYECDSGTNAYFVSSKKYIDSPTPTNTKGVDTAYLYNGYSYFVSVGMALNQKKALKRFIKKAK